VFEKITFNCFIQKTTFDLLFIYAINYIDSEELELFSRATQTAKME